MTTQHAISSIIEISLVILFIVGAFNEEKIARWEKRLFQKIKKIFIKQ